MVELHEDGVDALRDCLPLVWLFYLLLVLMLIIHPEM